MIAIIAVKIGKKKMSDIDCTEITLEEVKDALASYALEVHKLKQIVKDQADTIHRHEKITRQRKLDAGYSVNTSFDVVWNETLEKAKKINI